MNEVSRWRASLPTTTELGTALRLMRRPGWWGTLLAIVVVSITFVQLGEWQHHRYEVKRDRNAIVEANYDAPAQPLTAVLPSPEQPLTASHIWRPITVEGTYRDDQVLVRNRSLDDQPGFEVLAPLVLDDGTVFVVNRGWQATGDQGSTPSRVFAPPAGRVVVTARLRPSESAVTRQAPQGQIQRIDLAELYRGWGVSPTAGWQGFGVAAEEVPSAAETPQRLPRPTEDLGPHLGYAWQWWMFAVAAYSVFAYYLLREARTTTTSTRAPGSPAKRPLRGSRRRGDEDWEDALVSSGATVHVANRIVTRPDAQAKVVRSATPEDSSGGSLGR